MLGLVQGAESTTAPWSTPSPVIWGKHPQLNEFMDPAVGYCLHEDFNDFAIPATNTSGFIKGWNYFLSNAATITEGAIANVSSIAVTGGATDNNCASMALCTAGVRIAANSGRKVAFETRDQFSTIAVTTFGSFFGLFEPIVPTATSHIVDAGTLVDKNFIGFWRDETANPATITIVYKVTGQAMQSFTVAFAPVAAKFFKMGFLFDGVTTWKFFFNGIEYLPARLNLAQLSAATFPSGINLAPAMVFIKNAAAASNPMTSDWVRFGFTRNTADGLN